MATKFLITQAEKIRLGISDERFFHAAITNAGNDDGIVIKVESPALGKLFYKLSAGQVVEGNFGTVNGVRPVWDYAPAIHGVSFTDQGEDLYLDGGKMNFTFLRSTGIGERGGLDTFFPGPYTEEDQKQSLQALSQVAKQLFSRYLRASQKEFIIYTTDKED